MQDPFQNYTYFVTDHGQTSHKPYKIGVIISTSKNDCEFDQMICERSLWKVQSHRSETLFRYFPALLPQSLKLDLKLKYLLNSQKCTLKHIFRLNFKYIIYSLWIIEFISVNPNDSETDSNTAVIYWGDLHPI